MEGTKPTSLHSGNADAHLISYPILYSIYLSSVPPSRPRSHGPGPQTVPVLARLTSMRAIKNPCVVFKMENGGETLAVDSEGEGAFDEKPPTSVTAVPGDIFR